MKIEEWSSENVNHIRQYILTREDGTTQLILTIHLPSLRVSEKHYNLKGALEKYIPSSTTANEHIAYLCTQDDKLSDSIKIATEETRAKLSIINSQISKRKRTGNILDIMYEISKWLLISSVAAWVLFTIIEKI